MTSAPTNGSTPHFLVVGHVAKDLTPDGYTLGGTATYAGTLGLRLGLTTAVVTSCAPDIPVEEALAGVAMRVLPSTQSTTFRNEYDGPHRRQFLSGIAETLRRDDVPGEWRRALVVLLGPIADELGDDLFGAFPGGLVGLTPQGMMRAWDERGEVRAKRWDRAEALLPFVDVVILSDEDLPNADELRRYTERVPLVALTHGEGGATVYERGVPRTFEAYSCIPVDYTGAGDIFAAAFLLEMEASGSVERAAHFANSAASHVIEALGYSGVPTRAAVERRMAPATQGST